MDLTARAAASGVELVGVEGTTGDLAAGPERAFYALGDGAHGQALALAAALLLKRGGALSRKAIHALAATFLAGG